jgi:hypothetical protein
MTDSFWAGGREAYIGALREKLETQLNDLRDRCEKSDDTERAKLENEIERAKLEHQKKLDSIDDACF